MRLINFGISTLIAQFSFMSAFSNQEIMNVKKLSEFATIPVRGSKYSAGFDLAAAYDMIVPAKGKALVKTDIAISIPPLTYARVAPRSGLAWKNFIDTGAGVVDYDYRGNVGVILFNHAEVDFEIRRGDRIAQLILERISMADAIEVQELSDTERGAGGFGSTGVSSNDPSDKDNGDSNLQKRSRSENNLQTVDASELLLSLQRNQVSLGDERFGKLVPLALEGDSRLSAILKAFDISHNVDSLLKTVDIFLTTL